MSTILLNTAYAQTATLGEPFFVEKGKTTGQKEITDLQMAKIKVLQDHNVTINTLQEYERNKPIADYLTATKRELEKVKKERTYLCPCQKN